MTDPWIEDRLRKIAALLIDAHRADNRNILAKYARRLPAAAGGTPKRQFMQLIQVFHPDRLAVYSRQAAELRAAGDGKALSDLEAFLEYEHYDVESRRARPDAGSGTGAKSPRADAYGFDHEESYDYGEDDFGYGEDTASGEYADYEHGDYEDDGDSPFPEGSFMDAIKREFFGNLDLWPTKYEVEQFDGELDLSDYGINDLTGAEHCANVVSLNLAMNQIDNVWPLRDLSRLEFLDLSSNALESADDLGENQSIRELDLSFNDIDDVAFLLRMGALKCVSLAGNPVRDKTVLDTLRKNGVTVII